MAVDGLDAPIPGSVITLALSVREFLEAYGWYLLGVLFLYWLLGASVKRQLRRLTASGQARSAEIAAEERRVREEQQRRWDEQARQVYEADAAEKRRKNHERDRVRKWYDGERTNLQCGDSAAPSGGDGMRGYRPNIKDRYKGRGGGGGGG